jgi:predicted Zn-dependent protease
MYPFFASYGFEDYERLRDGFEFEVAKGGGVWVAIGGEMVAGDQYAGAFRLGGDLLSLKFSRSDETEADIVGLDIAARGGYDPRAGVTLWQKMMAANRSAPPEFLSTHPAGDSRIKDIERRLPDVMPLYEAARQG